jgi:hypothetical protein
MPSPLSVVERLDVVTGPFAYVRRLGDRESVDALTKTLDHIVIDRGPEVEADALAIRVLRQRVLVVAFVNNHYAGYVPEAHLRREYRRRLWRAWRARPNPSVLLVYALKCAMHYHQHTMARRMSSGRTPVYNSF